MAQRLIDFLEAAIVFLLCTNALMGCIIHRLVRELVERRAPPPIGSKGLLARLERLFAIPPAT